LTKVSSSAVRSGAGAAILNFIVIFSLTIFYQVREAKTRMTTVQSVLSRGPAREE